MKKKIICWKVAITISCILITISVLMLGYHFYRNKYVLKLNEEDRKNIKEIQIRANEHWENTVIMDLTNVDKIVWYFDFNDHVYEYYYDDGTIQTAYNDHIYELKEYIQLNGKMIGKEYFYLIILLVVFCVFATLKMLKNEDKLFFYKKDYNANIEKDINKTNL